MKNKLSSILLSTLLMGILATSFILSACTKPAQQTAKVDADANTIEKVACEYLAKEMGKNYDKADACIPWVYLVGNEVDANGDVTVYGDFWIDNFNVKGDTLENVSGGNYAGVMHMKKTGNTYTVSKFDMVEDGENYTNSAKKLFGEYYEAWSKFTNDDAAKQKVRTEAIANYAKENGLKVVKYQDYGWAPVDIPQK